MTPPKPSLTEKPYPRIENPTAYLHSLPPKTKLEKSVLLLNKLEQSAEVARRERNSSAHWLNQQGFTYAEIGHIIGVSPAVVKQYIKAHQRNLASHHAGPDSDSAEGK